MKIHIPYSSWLGNIEGVLKTIDTEQPDNLEITFDEKWISLHPVVFSIIACLGLRAIKYGGTIEITANEYTPLIVVNAGKTYHRYLFPRVPEPLSLNVQVNGLETVGYLGSQQWQKISSINGFITNDKSEIITLPLISVNEDNSKEKFVYVIENIQDNQGIIVKKKIKIGNIINNRIEVISGLTKNEKIVTAGVNRIVEGQKVKLYEEGK